MKVRISEKALSNKFLRSLRCLWRFCSFNRVSPILQTEDYVELLLCKTSATESIHLEAIGLSAAKVSLCGITSIFLATEM